MGGTQEQGGAFLIAWSQTRIDGRIATPDALVSGAYWRWTGTAIALEAAMPPCNDPAQMQAAAQDVLRRALGPDSDPVVGRTIILGDDGAHWSVTEMELAGGTDPLLLATDALPPHGQPVRIRDVTFRIPHSGGASATGLAPDAWVETPGGARQARHLVAGDKVLTRDAGLRELIWTGATHFTAGDLRRDSHLAPVRIRSGALGEGTPDADLVVSPEHRVLLCGLYAGRPTEVFVAARDLVDGRTILRTGIGQPSAACQLMLEDHHILTANGIETESFHPAACDLSRIAAADRQRLFDILPHLAAAPTAFGPVARPVLSAAEIAFLTAA